MLASLLALLVSFMPGHIHTDSGHALPGSIARHTLTGHALPGVVHVTPLTGHALPG